MKRLKEIFYLIASGEIQMVASALSFTTLLSIIPFFAVGLATLQYFDGLERLSIQVQSLLLEFFKGSLRAEDVLMIKSIIRSFRPAKLGFLGALGLFATSMLLIKEMENAFHYLWKIPNKRPLYKRVFGYWILLLCFPIIAAILASLSSVKAIVWINSGLPKSVYQFFLITSLCTLIFKAVPNVKVRWSSAIVGAIISGLGIVGLMRFYGLITINLFTYSRFYGSLASIPTFLIWILCLWYVVLLGVATSSIWNKSVAT